MFDSVKANTTFYIEILPHFNMPELTPEQTAYAQMHTFDETAAFLFKEPEMLQAAKTYRKQMNDMKFIRYLEIDPCLKPLLKWLRSRYKTAIATNRMVTIHRVLDEFDLKDDFDLVVSAQDVNRPKPDPEPLLKILEHFHVKPQEAIYVGDSALDETAAKGAGIPLVAYNNPALSAQYHIQSLWELKRILK
ncbi:MAG: HAD-IA family hydrolase, partial [Deltaproteobacteria bacterium]|nr:HAD-IA family hydrolase [Deltaproteobacteria bacterium]